MGLGLQEVHNAQAVNIATLISPRSSYDHRSNKHNLSNCVKKPEKVRTSMGFEPVTSQYRCKVRNNFLE